MVKRLIYILLFIFALVACEEIYRPNLENVGDFMVVEAELISNQEQNNIYLYKTVEFGAENESYPIVTGASVFLVDENNNQVQCEEITPGTYHLNYMLKTGSEYHLYIEYAGEKYESGIQTVPEIPIIDSVYVAYTTKTFTTGVSNSTDKINDVEGFQVYSDMKYKGGVSNYRFYARKIAQYINHYDTIYPMAFEPVTMPIFSWKSLYPKGVFNIAGPPKYSSEKDIKRHPLEFFESDPGKYISDTVMFAGWIYIIYQYGINEDTYNFYSDVNSQLSAEGKIFDPVYIQAKGNISCTTDPELNVLGNFEITTRNEKRVYLHYYKNGDTITALKPIPYSYDIPERGEIKDVMPDFWESRAKIYPDE